MTPKVPMWEFIDKRTKKRLYVCAAPNALTAMVNAAEGEHIPENTEITIRSFKPTQADIDTVVDILKGGSHE